MEGMESANAENMGEDMMEEMMRQFEGMGEKVVPVVSRRLSTTADGWSDASRRTSRAS
jgi:hypothetical protein